MTLTDCEHKLSASTSQKVTNILIPSSISENCHHNYAKLRLHSVWFKCICMVCIIYIHLVCSSGIGLTLSLWGTNRTNRVYFSGGKYKSSLKLIPPIYLDISYVRYIIWAFKKYMILLLLPKFQTVQLSVHDINQNPNQRTKQ